MSTAYWVDRATAGRFGRMRSRTDTQDAAHRTERAQVQRDIARLALIASLMVLAVLGVEMSRLAVHLFG